jgi:hypothetical protein
MPRRLHYPFQSPNSAKTAITRTYRAAPCPGSGRAKQAAAVPQHTSTGPVGLRVRHTERPSAKHPAQPLKTSTHATDDQKNKPEHSSHMKDALERNASSNASSAGSSDRLIHLPGVEADFATLKRTARRQP